MPFKQLHLTEPFDKNHREVNHPEIEQSVMFHLSKAVGKACLAPVEMMKEYISNPQFRDKMTTYVFDKQALEELRRDLLANPEKYEEALLKEREEDPFLNGIDHGSFKEGFIRKRMNWVHTYKMYNDGRGLSGIDDWPMQNEYNSYKLWAD